MFWNRTQDLNRVTEVLNGKVGHLVPRIGGDFFLFLPIFFFSLFCIQRIVIKKHYWVDLCVQERSSTLNKNCCRDLLCLYSHITCVDIQNIYWTYIVSRDVLSQGISPAYLQCWIFHLCGKVPNIFPLFTCVVTIIFLFLRNPNEHWILHFSLSSFGSRTTSW